MTAQYTLEGTLALPVCTCQFCGVTGPGVSRYGDSAVHTVACRDVLACLGRQRLASSNLYGV
jgi:hypothetical protein